MKFLFGMTRFFAPLVFVCAFLVTGTLSAQVLLQPTKKQRLSSDISRYVYAIPKERSRSYRIKVPFGRGDASFMVTAIAKNPGTRVTVTRIETPSGTLTYRYRPGMGLDDFRAVGVSYPIADDAEVSLIYPMHPKLPLEVGTYTVELELSGGHGLDTVAAIVKTGLGSKQAIDFNIWVALAEPKLKTKKFQSEFGGLIRRQMNSMLTPHKLQVGQLRFFNSSPSETSGLSRPHVDEVRSMCKLMQRRVPLNRAVNLIWVDEIFYRPDFSFGGIAAGQPGSLFVPQSSSTCVLAAYGIYGNNLNQHAINFLHEGSHLMGLPHTTELDGLTFDRFTDTPECALGRFDGRANKRLGGRGSVDGKVDDYECGLTGGANNFLFYGGLPEFEPFYISAQQAWVLRRHPLFYPVK